MTKIVEIPWSNLNYKEDMIHTLSWCRLLLKLLGLWPLVYPRTSVVEKVVAVVSFASCFFAFSFLLIPMFTYLLSSQILTIEKVKVLGPMGYVVISMLKYICLAFRYKTVRQCISRLNMDWCTVQREDHRRIMLTNVAKGHALCKICVTFMYGAGLGYNSIMPFIAQKSNYLLNITVRPIAFPGFDLFWDLDVTAIYVAVVGAQCLGSIVLYNVTSVVCNLAATFIAHACGQIQIIMSRMEDLARNYEDNHVKSMQRVAVIIQQHVQVLRFSAIIEHSLREICLVEVVGSTLLICLLEYYCMTEWNNSDSIAILIYFLVLLSFVFNTFVLCYISELLTDQCSKVGNNSYKIEWYRLPQKTALTLTMVISMSHQPVRLTAGKLINLSFASFGNVLKTSIAYFNLLRTFV